MPPTIRIDDDVYAWLQGQAKPFEDTPNSVLRRIAELDRSAESEKETISEGARELGGTKTPQDAYRDPILKVLLGHGGQASRGAVLAEIHKILESQLTPYDTENIESGDARWQKTAEWEVHLMRKRGLLQPDGEMPRGVWALTAAGETEARRLA